jgi:hypothetical protein
MTGPRVGRAEPGVRALMSVALVVGLGLGAAQLASPGTATAPAPTARPLPGYPTAGFESSAAPLGTPPPAPPAGGTHGFIAHQADGVTPVGYDPCRPVHYVIRPDHAPEGGGQLIRDAVARVAEVTGLRFVHDGPTAEVSTASRALFQPDTYGDRWAPVLISWQTEAENPEFGTSTIGQAGSAVVHIGGGPAVLATGVVDLDAAAFAELLAEPEGVPLARAVVLHELGHLVGLAHVPDDSQLMNSSTQDVLDYAAGDLTGLARLGAGACVPQL